MSAHPGPDLTYPGEVFVDGEHYYEVAVWPARFPVRFSQNSESGIFVVKVLIALYTLIVSAVTARLDDRYKVVVSRIGLKREYVWKVVHVEFLAGSEAAKTRRLDILTNWEQDDFANLPALRGKDRRDRRLAAQTK